MGCCGSKVVEVHNSPKRFEITPITDTSPILPHPRQKIEDNTMLEFHESITMIKPRDISPIQKKPIKPQSEVTYSRHKIKCDINETMLTLWVNKGETLKFRVEGAWQPDPSLPECSAKGFSTYTMEDFNYGALIGRILGEKYFNIFDFFVYINPVEGPLLMKMYSPKFQLKSSGELTVYIYGGTLIQQSELDRRIGWILYQVRSNILKFNFSKIEEELMIEINKLRVNPKLYTKLYINQNRVLTINYLNNKSNMDSYKVSWKLIGLLKEFWEIFHGQKSTEKMSREQQIELFLRDREVIKFRIIAQDYDEINPHLIFMKMLQNSPLKDIIFKETYDEFGLKITTEKNKTTVMIIFADVKEYVYRGAVKETKE